MEVFHLLGAGKEDFSSVVSSIGREPESQLRAGNPKRISFLFTLKCWNKELCFIQFAADLLRVFRSLPMSHELLGPRGWCSSDLDISQLSENRSDLQAG